MARTVSLPEIVPRRRLYSCGLAALAALLPEGVVSPEAEFLRAHSMDAPTRADLLDRLLASPDRADAPLVDLSRELGLEPMEVLAVALAAAVETELMCGRAIAHLQAPLGTSRPTLGLLGAAFAAMDNRVIERLLGGTAVQSGLLQILNESAPLAERAIAVPVPVCLALCGQDARWPQASLGLDPLLQTPLPPSTMEEAHRQARGLDSEAQRAIVVRGGSQSEVRSVTQEIAAALERRPLFIEWGSQRESANQKPSLIGLGPFLQLRALLPVFCMDLGPGERAKLPEIACYRGAILAVCGAEGSIEWQGETALSWKVAVPPGEERLGLWQAALSESELAAQLASGYRHGIGRIAHLGRLAHHRRILDGRPRPSFADVAAASWTIEGSGLEGLAQPLTDVIPDEAIVMTPALRDEMQRLLLRCLTRDSLIDGLGASALARFRPGVKALFTGASGTGKTLAAGWLATRLGLPLYRVDLAAVTSKYIGETEKNLAQLLARAEDSEIILLFDEADSLFGKRTEVKESNDRFANAQTNYLLQRIETFEGIAILTSNSRARFDPAFCRRLDMIVEFPLPGAEERRTLWLSHLGNHHRLKPRELNLLALSADLAGGHIRNAVLTAAVLARDAKRLIEYQDVLVGLADEYRKLSRQLPADLMAGSIESLSCQD